MSDIRSLPKWKRCLLFFSLLICFVFCFSLSSFASINYSVIEDANIYSSGLPLDFYYEVASPFDYLSNVIVNDANVFLENNSSFASVSSSVNTGSFSVGVYNTTPVGESSDVRVGYSGDGFAKLTRYSCNTMFTDLINDQIGLTTLQFFGTSSSIVTSSFNAKYNYRVSARKYDDDIKHYVLSFDHPIIIDYTAASDYYYTSFSLTSYNRSDVISIYSLLSDEGFDSRYITIDSFFVDLNLPSSGDFSNTIYIRDSNLSDPLLSDVLDNARDSYASLYSYDYIDVSFDDISWTDWLVNSVGSFMNFEIVPNLTISGIVALLVGMSLFMVFLKVFAGG